MTASTPDRQRRIRPGWLAKPSLQQAIAIIAEASGEARIAGGAVRNALLKMPVADIDLATTLAPESVAAAFRSKGHLVIPTGIEHGTVTVRIDGDLYEITTLRRDVSTDGRRAVVAFTDDWATDASRRDFTINAMYLDATGKLFDYTEGYKDIRNRRVRFVGAPGKRIEEDYLRILRFFRFHAIYAKGKPDAAALAACTRLRSGLKSLSAERIRNELLKLLAAPRAVETLKGMDAKKILGSVLPAPAKFTAETWRVISRLPSDGELRLAVLSANPDALKEKLKLSNTQTRRIAEVLEAPQLSPDLRTTERRRLLYALGETCWRDAVHLAWAKSRASTSDPKWKRLLNLPKNWKAPKFPIAGNDLKARGIAPGPQMGQVLRDLEDWWIASDFKATPGQLLARI
jgi:poly(A) polymerase